MGGKAAGPWLPLLAGPVLFLLAILGLSVALVAMGHPPSAIEREVSATAPAILCGVLGALAVLVLVLLPWRDLWRPGPGPLWRDLGIGAAVGLLLAVLYLALLAPVLSGLQAQVGDYVPPGAVLATISHDKTLFFIVNVLLAPAVEETIYRGHLLGLLTARFGGWRGVALTCLGFGLLHWTGGIWYMALTALVAGLPLAMLARWSGGLAAPWAAHLALNLTEFAASAEFG